jgi:SpoVK/Ycf46/Vps4 family AAA+-type ATPase
MDEQRKISKNPSIKVLSDFEYNSLDYYPFLDTEELFNQYSMSDSNILLLSGKPGTGKTKLGDAYMKFLLEKSKNDIEDKPILKNNNITNTNVPEEMTISYNEGVKVAYVKNEEILASDIFWNVLREENFHLVFLDDLDYSLIPRTQNISSTEDIQKNKFISNLLSFTDGIFETGNLTKFIITSNRSIKEIDTAILRKGRTFDILSLRELTKEEALYIWESKGLSEEEYKKRFHTSNVLQADLGSAIGTLLKAKENNVTLKSYIKEENISIYNEFKNPGKIGL